MKKNPVKSFHILCANHGFHLCIMDVAYKIVAKNEENIVEENSESDEEHNEENEEENDENYDLLLLILKQNDCHLNK